jgi:putative tricarboxylic transport membrane protein
LLENIVVGMGMVLKLDNILASMFGVTVGIVMGAIPGLSEITAICLLLPFTFYLKPIAAIAMLMGLCKGGNFGGSIPAILFNIPGTAQAVVTSFDGYPLTKQGKSGKALKMALYASTMADTLSDFILFFLAAPVAAVALMIGPPEYAMIVLFSLIVVGVAGSENFVKGMIAIGMGLFLAVIGLDPVTGTPRFTFGSIELSAGLAVIPIVLGLFVISEAFRQMELILKEKSSKNLNNRYQNQIKKTKNLSNHKVSLAEFKHCLPAIFGGVGIGSALGAIPGIGTTVAAYLSYMHTKRKSKHPELFGKGALEGVAAAEAGNNAVNGPNLIPLITLGIPGNLAAALILGAFMMQGLIPGPLFMQQYAPMLYALFTVLIISNIFTFTVGSLFVKYVRHLTYVPKRILYPIVIVFASIGAYIFRSNLFDLIIMFTLGILGYILVKIKIPIPPILVAFILGEILEKRMRQALIISGGSSTIFFTKPISLAFFLLTIFVVLFFIRGRKKNKI